MSNLVVYGGAGALGRSVVTFFKEKGWTVTSIDLVENVSADHNAIVNPNATLQDQAKEVQDNLASFLGAKKLKAILCVAGGWAGGNAASKDFLANSELMWKQSVYSSFIAAQVAARHLESDGLLTLTGALAANGPTPGMIGYGVAKAAVHHLVKDLASPGSGLPPNAKVTAVCPVTLDTPMNRSGMPKADFSSWTPTETVAKQLYAYATGTAALTSGSLLEVVTKNGETTFKEI
ncbi:hypothetical protein J3Q64DRAFT_1023671 [Phycomyces blakesleeanus]|uniref:Dihydropteridine reductase n=2 Tax=Phycomyces blakesleeanus TaxID=4837 RepID=A0A162URQ6_PHYB8|nr:hypothetical protein PHYBLDRAFT_36399 [Phycomyces blakesleeanus NRRL 1555(-)]OAD77373.1 hypothetical protein PHYBLDRAFT_36399 [Phycomyces blakesleeanus NRRL 1555(-)]|eukprot:XP_018295413.1 hypothetical protein PHYBLDRAFT_36399 [Phycomyces blakesleeanus NRRL 1555(-)]